MSYTSGKFPLVESRSVLMMDMVFPAPEYVLDKATSELDDIANLIVSVAPLPSHLK